MASAVSGMRVVYDKEGVDPCIGDAHYFERIHQRRREWPAPRLRGVARGAGPSCTNQPIPAQPDRRGQRRRPSEATNHGPPSEAVVVAVTKGRLDFGTWERIFYGEFDGRRRKRVLVKIIGE
jgi:hypothetical protein